MNAERRKQITAVKARIEGELAEAISNLTTMLDEIRSEIDSIKDDEQAYRDAMPESLGDGEKGQKADAAIEALEEAVRVMDDIADSVENLDTSEVTSGLDTASE